MSLNTPKLKPLPTDYLLSVVMPVYNEKNTIRQIIDRVLSVNINKELVIVDDCSKDGTSEILKEEYANNPMVRLFHHEKNRGKGAAIQLGFREAKGNIVIIQDADLEYYPEEYSLLLKPIIDGKADVVYGSRFLGAHRVFMFWHYQGNRFLTFMTNMLYNTMLTDMETCYKAFRAEVIKNMNLRSNRFNIEPEITAKVFKQGYRVYEVPISYDGRGYEEGKKITWKDGIFAILTLIKYRFVD